MKEITVQNNIETLLAPSVREKEAPEGQGKSFGEIMNSAIDEVSRVQQEADRAVRQLAAGKEKDIHNTMIALEKAEVSFQLMLQVRNKIISAYETIMRMNV